MPFTLVVIGILNSKLNETKKMEIRNNIPFNNLSPNELIMASTVNGNGQSPMSLMTRPPPPSTVMVPMIPPGLQALYNCCARIYPDQPNPLQVTAVIKFWYITI